MVFSIYTLCGKIQTNSDLNNQCVWKFCEESLPANKNIVMFRTKISNVKIIL